MFRRFFKKYFLTAVGIANLFLTSQAMAVTQSMTAYIAFDAPLSLTKTSDINFGTIKIATADTYTITTSGAVTPAGPGAHLRGATTAGSITVVGSPTQEISISTDEYTANGGVT